METYESYLAKLTEEEKEAREKMLSRKFNGLTVGEIYALPKKEGLKFLNELASDKEGLGYMEALMQSLEFKVVADLFNQEVLHSHKHCGIIWNHRMCETDNQEEYDNSHKCPKCGKMQRVKYHGKGSIDCDALIPKIGLKETA